MLLVALSAGGCRKHDPSPAPGPAVSLTGTSADAGASPMVRHEALGLELGKAIRRADLVAARRVARDLSRVRLLPSSAEYGERSLDMALAAAAVAGMEDVAESGAAFGALARTCADCHARLTGPTRLTVRGTPPALTMPRHAWAMDRLWDGLIANSEAPWRAGAGALADRALIAEELMPKKTPTVEVDRFASAIQSGGRAALATTDTGERARVFGELVAACGGCHERTGGGGPR